MSKTNHTITAGQTEAGKPFEIDVDRLIVSRGLITASSGGGKSYLLRKLLEELSATTQTIVIDPEGEYSTLREIRDMLLVGGDGDLPADPRSAGLLCRRLMELNVSAVLDIYELPPAARRQFVANFLTEMVNLPKSLWRNCFVVIDEAHEFAPNSTDKNNVSRDAVGLLFSKGRKRGFCPIIATQRFAKLSMDVAAEARNRFVGLQNQDVDQRRAADSLGWDKSKWTQLRDLSPPGSEGEFFAYGPALAERGVVKFRAGKVKSTHPHAGDGTIPEPPQPSKRIAGVLSELKDLPQKAEEEIRSLDAAARRIAELEQQLRTQASNVAGKTGEKTVTEKPSILRLTQTISTLKKSLGKAMKVLRQLDDLKISEAGLDPKEVRKSIESATAQIVDGLALRMRRTQDGLAKLQRDAKQLLENLQQQPMGGKASPSAVVAAGAPESGGSDSMDDSSDADQADESITPSEGLSKGEQKILNTIATLDARAITITKDTLARWLNVHRNNGNLGTDLGRLRRDGYLENFSLTSTGKAIAQANPTGLEAAFKALPDASKKKLLRVIVGAGRKLSKDELADLIGVHRNNGNLGTDLGYLRAMQLVTAKGIEPTPEAYK